MSENTSDTDDLGTPFVPPSPATQTAPDAEPVGGAREINVFSMDYKGSGMDFRPMPVGYDVPDELPGEDPAPKDSSVAESVASSAELADVIPTPEEATGPAQETPPPTPQPPIHPSQLQSPATTASAEKASGQPKVPAASKQTSSEAPKTG